MTEKNRCLKSKEECSSVSSAQYGLGKSAPCLSFLGNSQGYGPEAIGHSRVIVMRQFWAVTDAILAVHVGIIKLILQSAPSQEALKMAGGGIYSYGENSCLKSAFNKTATVSWLPGRSRGVHSGPELGIPQHGFDERWIETPLLTKAETDWPVGLFPHYFHKQHKNAALRKWLHGSQSETLQKQLVIVLVPHFKTKIDFVWSINSGRMWYISLCILIVLSSSNSSFLIVGNYFLRKAHLVCTWKASDILLQEQVLLWYSVKQLQGETFIKFGSWLPAEVKATSLPA